MTQNKEWTKNSIERYIGITGFKTKEQVEACRQASIGLEPIIMYGVLTSQKTLIDPTSEGTKRPALVNITGLLEYIPKTALPTIHHYTENRQFMQELGQILSFQNIYDKGFVKAVQLNQRLPDISEVEKLKNQYSNIKIILQLEPQDIATPEVTGKIVSNYQGLVDYVIIDPSRGIGKELNIHDTLKVLNNLKIDAIPVIAGGLSKDNVYDLVKFFRKEYGNNLCIDAEGKLMNNQGTLSIDKMKGYLDAAYRGYESKKNS
jgi:phosphoribosylanthranilate isomerase